MAQQQHTISYLDGQLSDMINDLYINEMGMEADKFVPMRQPSPPMALLGTRNTTVSLPVSAGSSSSISSKRNRTAATTLRQHDDHMNIMTSTVHEKYHSRTLGSHNITRMSILPIFPCTDVRLERVTTADSPTTALSTLGKTAHLLLCNVPIDSLSREQYARLHRGTFPPLFRLEVTASTGMNTRDSFLLGFYQDLYVNLKKRFKVDISVLDSNLSRLRRCVDLVVAHYSLEQTMFNLDELAIALEFYLQIDVDMFFLKTCSFNGVEPRLFEQRHREGLFCLDTPTARFAITPCQNPSCLCCQSACPRRYVATVGSQQTAAIQFSNPHIHRFVNRYEAILNCPATCESKNCLYVLTCPCGQLDFIGESKASFAETLAMHREEGNRIIREFLIGKRNIEHTTRGLKSEKKKANDQLWFYQHSARCSAALQLFLDYNPEYWCFVPTKSIELNSMHGTVRGYLSRQPTFSREIPSASESDFSTTWTRKDAEVHLLVSNVPKPPLGYDFDYYQRQQQAHFFKYTQDRHLPLNNVDVYNADIIAILPENASKLFRKLIESLLITHAECKLNQTGHLLLAPGQSNTNPNHSLEGVWCVHLARGPSSLS